MDITDFAKEIGAMLYLCFAIVKQGLTFTSLVYFVHDMKRKFSYHTTVDEPDPTMWKRPFRRFFDTVFAPVGSFYANIPSDERLRAVLYQVSIGATVISMSVILYMAAAGLTLGTAALTYYTAGFVPNVVPAFKTLIGVMVLSALSVMYYAGERAKAGKLTPQCEPLGQP